MLFQFNGMAYSGNGLDDYELMSGDQAGRSSHNSSLRSSHHVHSSSSTQQLEPKSVPPDVANTLEHIVGQLDILTQVMTRTQAVNTHTGDKTYIGD